jgi:hypothetical protein
MSNIYNSENPIPLESEQTQSAAPFIQDPQVPTDNIDKVLNIENEITEKTLVSDLFYNFASIDGLDFRKIYPYSFVIYDEESGSGREIFLPLPPSAFTMDIPSATQLTVTLGGIVEESNGAPLRTINISGSTGIINSKDFILPIEQDGFLKPDPAGDNRTSDSPDGSSSDFLSLATDYAIKTAVGTASGALSNTLGQLQSTYNSIANAIQKTVRPFGGSINFYPLNKSDNDIQKKTGFYWFHSLLRFFEYYLHIKKTEEGKKIRLIFNVYKDRQFFYVTINNFRWQKIPGSIEYNYSISLTAWKKVQPNTIKQGDSIVPVSSSFNIFDTLRQGITGVRQIVLSLQKVFYAANQDIYENVLVPLSEINLLIKDKAGLSKTCGDFFDQFENGSFKNSVSRYVKSNEVLYNELIQVSTKTNYVYGSPQSNSTASLDKDNKNLSSSQSQTNILPEDMIKNPYKYWNFYDEIPIDSLQLDQKTRSAINSKVNAVRSFTIYDLKKRKEKLELFSKTFSESAVKDKGLNLNEVSLSAQLNSLIMICDVLINYYKNQPKNVSNDYYNYYVDYAVSNGLDLTKARSKFFVPFPVGVTLESLAVQYLKDAGRWLEIAALNGLKAPYVDEEGFDLYLKSNGNQSTILLSTRENLYVGQVVTISSDTEQNKKIKIKEITEFSKNEYLISFEGELDLSIYKLPDNAKIHAYLPNTVNSDMLIAIPSNSTPINQNQVNLGPGLDQLNSVAQMSKIDLLLTNNGDIALTPGGDIRRATGFTNLSQAAKIKLLTRQGSMLHRPNFGNPLQDGISIANFDAKKYLSQLNQTFGQDQRFTGILFSNIKVAGPAVDVTLLIGTSNAGVNLPITTTVPISNV